MPVVAVRLHAIIEQVELDVRDEARLEAARRGSKDLGLYPGLDGRGGDAQRRHAATGSSPTCLLPINAPQITQALAAPVVPAHGGPARRVPGPSSRPLGMVSSLYRFGEYSGAQRR